MSYPRDCVTAVEGVVSSTHATHINHLLMPSIDSTYLHSLKEIGMRLLLIEDDSMLATAVRSALEQQQWVVEHRRDVASAKTALVAHGYSAVLLDLGLSGESGLDVLTFLRRRNDPIPVIILTARGELTERIQGLDAGADDYLVKPFQVGELQARLRALLRRADGKVVGVLARDGLSLDPLRQRVTLNGQYIPLSAHEFQILHAFLRRPSHIITRDDLERFVYGETAAVGSNTISVFIHQLRRKLGPSIIRTVHGVGYTFGESS